MGQMPKSEESWLSEQLGPRGSQSVVDLLQRAEGAARFDLAILPMVVVTKMASPPHGVLVAYLSKASIGWRFPYGVPCCVPQETIDCFSILMPGQAGECVCGPRAISWRRPVETISDEIKTLSAQISGLPFDDRAGSRLTPQFRLRHRVSQGEVRDEDQTLRFQLGQSGQHFLSKFRDQSCKVRGHYPCL